MIKWITSRSQFHFTQHALKRISNWTAGGIEYFITGTKYYRNSQAHLRGNHSLWKRSWKALSWQQIWGRTSDAWIFINDFIPLKDLSSGDKELFKILFLSIHFKRGTAAKLCLLCLLMHNHYISTLTYFLVNCGEREEAATQFQKENILKDLYILTNKRYAVQNVCPRVNLCFNLEVLHIRKKKNTPMLNA